MSRFRLLAMIGLSVLAIASVAAQLKEQPRYTVPAVNMQYAAILLEPGGLSRLEEQFARTKDLATAAALAASGEPRLWPVLLAMADHPDYWFPSIAAQIVHHHPNETKPILKELADAGSPNAARMLRWYVDVPPEYRDLRNHPNPAFRIIEIEAMKDYRDVAPLVGDPDPDVRLAAAKKILRGAITIRFEDLFAEDPEAIPATSAWREARARLGKHPDWRIRAALAKSSFGSRLLPELARDSDPRVRMEIYRHLDSLLPSDYTIAAEVLPLLLKAAKQGHPTERSLAMDIAMRLVAGRKRSYWGHTERRLLDEFAKSPQATAEIRRRVARYLRADEEERRYSDAVRLLVATDLPDRFALLDKCLSGDSLENVIYALEDLEGEEALDWWLRKVLRAYGEAMQSSEGDVPLLSGRFSFMLVGLGKLPAFRDATPFLQRSETCDRPRVREGLIEGLANLSRDPRTLVTLERLAKSGSQDATWAIRALGQTGQRYARDVLQELLSHPDLKTVRQAQSAMRTLEERRRILGL